MSTFTSTIDLSSRKNLSLEDINYILYSYKGKECIREINLNHTSISQLPDKAILLLFPNLESLKILHTNINKSTHKNYLKLCYDLQSLPNLIHLDIDLSHETDVKTVLLSLPLLRKINGEEVDITKMKIVFADELSGSTFTSLNKLIQFIGVNLEFTRTFYEKLNGILRNSVDTINFNAKKYQNNYHLSIYQTLFRINLFFYETAMNFLLISQSSLSKDTQMRVYMLAESINQNTKFYEGLVNNISGAVSVILDNVFNKSITEYYMKKTNEIDRVFQLIMEQKLKKGMQNRENIKDYKDYRDKEYVRDKENRENRDNMENKDNSRSGNYSKNSKNGSEAKDERRSHKILGKQDKNINNINNDINKNIERIVERNMDMQHNMNDKGARKGIYESEKKKSQNKIANIQNNNIHNGQNIVSNDHNMMPLNALNEMNKKLYDDINSNIVYQKKSFNNQNMNNINNNNNSVNENINNMGNKLAKGANANINSINSYLSSNVALLNNYIKNNARRNEPLLNNYVGSNNKESQLLNKIVNNINNNSKNASSNSNKLIHDNPNNGDYFNNINYKSNTKAKINEGDPNKMGLQFFNNKQNNISSVTNNKDTKDTIKNVSNSPININNLIRSKILSSNNPISKYNQSNQGNQNISPNLKPSSIPSHLNFQNIPNTQPKQPSPFFSNTPNEAVTDSSSNIPSRRILTPTMQYHSNIKNSIESYKQLSNPNSFIGIKHSKSPLQNQFIQKKIQKRETLNTLVRKAEKENRMINASKGKKPVMIIDKNANYFGSKMNSSCCSYGKKVGAGLTNKSMDRSISLMKKNINQNKMEFVNNPNRNTMDNYYRRENRGYSNSIKNSMGENRNIVNAHSTNNVHSNNSIKFSAKKGNSSNKKNNTRKLINREFRRMIDL